MSIMAGGHKSERLEDAKARGWRTQKREAGMVPRAGSWVHLSFTTSTKQEKQTGRRVRIYTVRAHPSDTLPPVSPHPKFYQTASPTWDQLFKYGGLWGTFLIKTTTMFFPTVLSFWGVGNRRRQVTMKYPRNLAFSYLLSVGNTSVHIL